VTVAVVDSGVEENADLAGKVLTRVDFVHDGVTSYDPGGHGTFIAGLIAGSVTGVDPSARIVSLRVLNERGVGTVRNALAAFDWLLRNRRTYGVRVVNLSWGAPQRLSYDRDVLAAAAESLWFAGMTVVAAAGNDGPAPQTINTPGADPFVITVGSVNQKGTLPTSDDRESTWSSNGPTLDGFAKPDLLAPGENVVSLRVPGSFLDQWYSDHTTSTGPGYTTMSGTSVSTAIVSGTAALLLAANPLYGPTQVKSVLVSTAKKIRGSKTPELDPAKVLDSRLRPVRWTANAFVRPSLLLLKVIAGQISGTNITWENLTWESISWETITWENITWESLTWESLTWESLTWEKLKN
jgi:serine protease AprX